MSNNILTRQASIDGKIGETMGEIIAQALRAAPGKAFEKGREGIYWWARRVRLSGNYREVPYYPSVDQLFRAVDHLENELGGDADLTELRILAGRLSSLVAVKRADRNCH